MFHLARILILALAATASAQWRVLPPTGDRTPPPATTPADAAPIKPGDAWPNDDRFRWVVGELTIPETLDGKPVAGRCVALRFNCGDGGEIWLGDTLRARFDNDHPALIILSERATPSQSIRVAAQIYAKVQGGDRFSEAQLVLIDPDRLQPVPLQIRADTPAGPVPDGIVGLSQGGGMSDYEPATAQVLKQGGFKWFRMDNVLTNAARRDAAGQIAYEFTELDRRVDFIAAVGAQAILAASYMPEALDAIPDPERHSAPRDYAEWEELCFRAAQRCRERNRRVAFWEVWNEVNAGWLKPGPGDGGGVPWQQLYRDAAGKNPDDPAVVRRLEAYCRLYRATARGVRRADPDAKIGGPALASGPTNESPGVHGQTFARALMLFCQREKLPLDFLSWHEYFQPADVIARQADAFRNLLKDFRDFAPAGDELAITEWNQAWWPDRPHDHEIGAAWCADSLIRAILPKHIRRPCFFYVKQGDDSFRGDWSLLMPGNRPKPVYHVLSAFNHLSGRWLPITGQDDDVHTVAAIDEANRRLRVIILNYRDRYALARDVTLTIRNLQWRDGTWRASLVDSTHSNVFHDRERSALQSAGEGPILNHAIQLVRPLRPNSIWVVDVAGG